MKAVYIVLVGCILVFGSAFVGFFDSSEVLSFRFKGQHWQFDNRMYPNIDQLGIKSIGELDIKKFDTLSNVFYVGQNYVEIIRQDDKIQPQKGLAIGFSYNPEQDTLPFVAEKAVMQFRDFRWGGVQFSGIDTANHTGVVNEFSEDFILTVLRFENDTLEAEFKGVLLNGAGEMSPIEEGYLKVGLLRKK